MISAAAGRREHLAGRPACSGFNEINKGATMTLTINKKTRSRQHAFGWARVASVALTYPLSILFAMAAGTKVMKYATYRSYLHASGLMGDGAAWWLSFMLPALELTVAALLVWPRTRRAGLLTAIALLPCYHYYIYYAL